MAVHAPAVSGRRRRSTAAVSDMAQLVGDIHIEAEVSIAPGASVQAEAASVYLGSGSQLHADVVVRAAGSSRVLGDDGQDYGVWIGSGSVITSKVVLQSPAYVGSDCFIGFRSTVFNARIGSGSIVMMHALVQDVEIPPGRFVPSGAVVTDQEAADQLPEVQPEDLTFAQEVLGGQALPFGAVQPGTIPGKTLNERDGLNTMQNQKLAPEVVQQVRQLLAQGYHIGSEHADARRFRSNVWQTCSPITSAREREVFAALETCLAEHAGEYVRLFGIDPRAKRRVAPVTIQRPDGRAVHMPSRPVPSVAAGKDAAPVGGLSGEVVQQVRQMLQQGYHIGTEHADTRRFRSNVWHTCSPIQSTREGEVFSALEACLAEHSGEYVRLFGIDPRAKRRVAPVTIQRPDGKPIEGLRKTSSSSYSSGSSSSASSHSSSSYGSMALGSLPPEAVKQVKQLLAQGYRVGAEHADRRRYRSNVWQTCPPIQSSREQEVLGAIATCLQEHATEYVRIFGIDPQAKRRVSSITVQRPDGRPVQPAHPGTAAAQTNQSPATASQNGHSNGAGSRSQNLTADLAQQVRQMVNQGYRLSLEHADVRRYRSGAWQTGSSLQGSQRDILAALESQLQEHSGEYVRLIGTDPQAKRRVSELTIQRP